MAKRKTARKTSPKRSPAKAKGAKRAKRPAAPRGVNLRKIREDLARAIEAMKKRPAGLAARAAVPGTAVARLEEAAARLEEFCTEDKGCGSTMIVPD